MDRRAFLAGVAAGLSGCGAAGDDEPAATLTPAPVPTASERSRRTPDRRTARFDDLPCPDLAADPSKRVCSHTAPDDATLVLAPDPVVVPVVAGAPTEPVRMTLLTDVTERLTTFTDDWRLFRREFQPGERPVESDPRDSAWTQVAGGEADRSEASSSASGSERREDERVLAPDEDHTWVLGRAEDDREYVTAVTAPLEPGVYAFVVVVSGEVAVNRWACAAVFEAVAGKTAADGG